MKAVPRVMARAVLLVRIPFISRDRNSAQTGSREKENYLYN